MARIWKKEKRQFNFSFSVISVRQYSEAEGILDLVIVT